MPNREMSSFVPARLQSQATPLRVACGSIATTPFRVVCGPTATTLLPTMIHPSLAAADLRQPDDVYAKVSRVTWRKADVRPFVVRETHTNGMESAATDKQMLISC